jgi:hypothetical protein
MAKSHYLEPDRLANLIAAIQILGVSDRDSGTLNRWVAELESSEELTSEQIDHAPIKYAERKKWATVFEQHPEFFKTYTLRGEQHVLLRWRYAQSINVKLKSGEDAASEDGNQPKDADEVADDAANDAAKPLTAEQIQVLIKTAIELHDREAASIRTPDRISPFLLATVGAALGTVAGGTVVVLLGWLQIVRMARIFD